MRHGESKPGGPYLGMSVARMVLAERLQRFLDAECADFECPHERLPFDPSPICGCFEVEGAVVRRLPEQRRERKKRAA